MLLCGGFFVFFFFLFFPPLKKNLSFSFLGLCAHGVLFLVFYIPTSIWHMHMQFSFASSLLQCRRIFTAIFSFFLNFFFSLLPWVLTFCLDSFARGGIGLAEILDEMLLDCYVRSMDRYMDGWMDGWMGWINLRPKKKQKKNEKNKKTSFTKHKLT